MSEEKIDLASIVENLRAYDVEDVIGDHELLALVAAVRAARRFVSRPENECPVALFQNLHEALDPFTDSAEVRSDGE